MDTITLESWKKQLEAAGTKLLERAQRTDVGGQVDNLVAFGQVVDLLDRLDRLEVRKPRGSRAARGTSSSRRPGSGGSR